ncbi:hypothetical protein ACGFNQ_02615 [Streptomyces asoensis]|uniref:hypothetical protein n=1 Tax=Streptomyces asoensis TaxID=249586 RepID=UPI003711EA31
MQIDHADVAARCRATPGQWQEVGEYNSTLSASRTAKNIGAAYVNPRKPTASPYAPAGSFEAVHVLTEFGARVEARYVGSSEAIRDLETAVRELGALPVPAGDFVTPGQPDRLTRTFAPTQALREEADES